MVKNCIYLLFSLCVSDIYAQVGFNKSYDFEALASGFSSIESSSDTVFVYGLIVNAETDLTGILLSRLDSLGNVISSSTYFDKDGDSFTRPYQNSLIKLSDNSGFVGVGQLFGKTNGYFIKYNNNAEILLYKEFPDTLYTFNHFKEIIEADQNSFLIVGNEAYKDEDITNGFVIKIDENGEIIWERKYYDTSKITFLGSIIKKNDNCYLVGGLRTDPGSVQTAQRRYSSLLLAIDSVGTVINSWSTNYSLDELGIGDMEIYEDTNIVYSSLRGNFNEEFNQIYSQPLLIFRDNDFKLLNTKTFGSSSPYPHTIANVHLLENNDWLTVGAIPQNYPIPPKADPINSLSGWITRLNESGNIYWTFTDTAYWSFISGSNNVLYDAIELSSGSIIACGYNRTNEPTPKDWAWLLKVSKDGCIDTLDCEIVKLEIPQKLGISVYPNPARDFIIFNTNDVELEFRSLTIFDSQGKIISNNQNVELAKPFQLRCENFPRGMYYYKYLATNGRSGIGQIVLE